MSDRPEFLIRKFAPSDREVVRRLCCETGFLGNPIDPVFEDRELFADYLTRYYTDEEPESTFVLEVGGEVRGYLMGCRHHANQKQFDRGNNPRLLIKGLCRYFKYNAASKKFARWVLSKGWRETPPAPKGIPLFHINLLADARRVDTTRGLIDSYLQYLRDCGEKQVFAQMTTFEFRRTTRMFERYGFRVLNRSEITKYADVFPGKVFLTTVIKDLEENTLLYKSAAKSESSSTIANN